MSNEKEAKRSRGHSSSHSSGGGFFDKVKKTFNDTTTAAGVELSYVNRKRKGFVHAPEIEEHINIMRDIRDEVPSLQGRVASVNKHEKEMAESERKGAAEFQKQSEVQSLHPQLAQIYTLWASKLSSNAAHRFQYQAELDSVTKEWKVLETNDLHMLQEKQDTTNKNFSNAKYWEKKNPSKSADYDAKYKDLVGEWIGSIHDLRMKKEEYIPQWVLRCAQAEVTFLRAALKEAEMAEAAIRELGQPRPNPPPDLSRFTAHVQGYEIDDESDHPAYQKQAQPARPPVPPTIVTPPSVQARGLYSFNASNPGELSFNVGDVLTILSQDGGWWKAEMNGQQGVIPSNYVQLI